MTTYMFPGQGSQIVGMGGELFPHFPDEIAQIDALLGYSIVELCVDDPLKQLGNTQYTQPALYVVETLSYLKACQKASTPNYCIGHSLGEYSALFAAGAFDLITGLQLVQKRGELMAKAHGGSMLAVIDLPAERIKSLLQEHGVDSIDFANFNSNKQIVLSGPAADIITANEILNKEAKMCVPLKVSGAFHSRYMQPAADAFAQFIKGIALHPLQIPVIANVSAQPYKNEEIKANLVAQITHSVCWTESISYLRAQGETSFIEIGPGQVLTRLLAQI